MTQKILTEAERTTKFNEWLSTQPIPKHKNIEERQRWWVNKVIEFDKMLDKDGWNIVPGFYVNNAGKVIYDNKE